MQRIKGNEKKRQIVKKINSEIDACGGSFSLFRQEDAIDCYYLEQIRANARKEGLKVIFIPNRILKVSLAQTGFKSENFDSFLKYNNFIVLSKDPIRSTTLINCIKDKKLKAKVQIKAVLINKSLFYEKNQISSLIRIGSEMGLKIMIIQMIRRILVKFIKTIDAHTKID